MADFAKWVVAGEGQLPWSPGKFIEVYEGNRKESMLDMFESELFVATLRDFLESKGNFQGTTAELLKELETHSHQEHTKDKSWPKAPNKASERIKRIAPALRKSGVSVEQTKKAGKKIWTFMVTEARVNYRDLPN